LDILAKKRAAELALEDNMKKNESTRTHYERIKQTEKNLIDKIALLKSNGNEKTRIKDEQEKLDEVKKRRERFEKLLKQNSNSSSTSRQNNYEKQAKELIIKEANIIVATLNYTGNSLFDCLNKQVGVVVIDEAAQCIEVDSLIPLRFGCNKIVLVGDPEQLPATVKNQRAQENGLAQSLFERIYIHFKYDDNNPIRMLYVQYRMHKDICTFPSKRFYKGKLTTDE
jgi:senataxin